ncbi:MAG: TIGR01777 family oxidoreductase [Verrucomicrobiia bacterium]
MNATPKRIVLAGGSGFLGRILGKAFVARGDEVAVLTRSPHQRNDCVTEIAWDGKSPGDWTRVINGSDVVINLAGKSVDCRYHASNRLAIMESRVDSTRVLGQVIGECKQPPALWLNSSTATIYKHSLDQPMDEAAAIGATAEVKDAFSIEVACAWEKVFNEAQTPNTRKVALRTAMVLGPNGGVFPVLRRLTQLGLGGKMGNGRQYVSWIHAEDFCRSIEWIMSKTEFYGAVNVAAPHPLPNLEMMRAFRHLCGIPFGIPATAWMLELGAFVVRTETELMIKSRRVVPGRLLASGFQFHFQNMAGALCSIQHTANVGRAKHSHLHRTFFEMP